jgi:flagellar motor switch protein FliN/FliY
MASLQGRVLLSDELRRQVMNSMASPSEPISHEVQQYLAAQARGEAATSPLSAPVSTKGKRSKKGAPSPHFDSPPHGATADSSSDSNDIDGRLAEAEQALASVNSPAEEGHPPPTMFQFRDLAAAPGSDASSSWELIREVELDLKIELGRTQMVLEDVLKLCKGSVVALDRLAGDPVDVLVNGRLIARGEVLVMNDNFCVRVTELIS